MKTTERSLNTIEEAIEEIKAGRIVIVVDDEDRENEGDFIAAAATVTDEMINFMTQYGRGLLCAPLTRERCQQLKLDLMVGENTSLHSTPFTVSVDLLTNGCTTGISVSDRTKTLRALVDPATKPEELGRPGHIFPLMAQDKGVLRRPGHTEAVVDLTKIAGIEPGGVLIEIMNPDGTMARLPQLFEIADKWGIKIISIADLIRYRLERETLVRKGVTAELPTEFGTFKAIPFLQVNGDIEHIALVKGEWKEDEPVLVRMHSSCLTGDVFGSCRCDCGAQLHESMRMIDKEGKGVIVYLSQEGRGIGLMNKLHAYKLQEEGLDTVEANVKLGFAPDERDYGVGATILRELGVRNIRLLTNNPQKRAALEGYGLKIVENIPIIIKPNSHNLHYLETKERVMGHKLGLTDSH
ncbi:MAG: bifunctional 3,4-dihydroxy-2-butanone-4-phosphate synthase/GTP cyclohydrolase II [Rikenellaceae bacterium]|nr:bifunctional 3,4-dihydroxy-2-butanone-4-phosphate synthase/GTP cyclohydrolase II [Rikenellaceae bacterium]